ncbi:MAG: NADH-quinone oxidoreductase subunit A [Acidimicrobiia bacterium]|nr:NADH-quinone oxidoreductase subunit A [Acidimicrobiia bacterium]
MGLGQYLPIFVMLVLALVFGAMSRVASHILAPRLSTVAKTDPYECGIDASQEPPERFPVTFYLVAMIFIVFDIEIIFMFPYAAVFSDLGVFGFVAVAIFAFALFESFVYLIGNGAMEWGPARKAKPEALVSPERTAATTIRRVGTEGRPAAAATVADRTPVPTEAA